MIRTNYHTHCRFCDGAGEPEEYVLSALEKGFTALGFSSHAPLPFENDWTMSEENLAPYAAEIRRLAEAYRGRIEIYLGLEIDFIPGLMGPSDERYAPLGLDYRIGSVHIMQDERSGRYPTVDGPFEEYESILHDICGGDVRAFIDRFYALVAEMALEHRPDIIGHFDLVQKNNRGRRYFSGEEDWYRAAAEKALDAVAEAGSILEVNSGGMARKRTDSPYPSLSLLRAAHERGIPVMMNADAHAPGQIDAHYDEGFRLIREAGYREVQVFTDRTWRPERV